MKKLLGWLIKNWHRYIHLVWLVGFMLLAYFTRQEIFYPIGWAPALVYASLLGGVFKNRMN